MWVSPWQLMFWYQYLKHITWCLGQNGSEQGAQSLHTEKSSTKYQCHKTMSWGVLELLWTRCDRIQCVDLEIGKHRNRKNTLILEITTSGWATTGQGDSNKGAIFQNIFFCHFGKKKWISFYFNVQFPPLVSQGTYNVPGVLQWNFRGLSSHPHLFCHPLWHP
jgi:hypothetical protein